MGVIATADGSKTLTSATFGETYGSRHGALSEALHVYLRGSGVESRLAGRLPTRVLEVGFGTGLNFLVSAASALEHGTPLQYTALEREPLDAAVLSEVHEGTSLPAGLVSTLLDWTADTLAIPEAGTYRLTAGSGGTVTLDLVVGEALRAAECGVVGRSAPYDAIYLDAFSPKANPELWTTGFLTALATSLAPGGVLVTFSVSGAVRRALAAAGLSVAKRPGPPGGKPEMLAASRPPSPTLERP